MNITSSLIRGGPCLVCYNEITDYVSGDPIETYAASNNQYGIMIGADCTTIVEQDGLPFILTEGELVNVEHLQFREIHTSSLNSSGSLRMIGLNLTSTFGPFDAVKLSNGVTTIVGTAKKTSIISIIGNCMANGVSIPEKSYALVDDLLSVDITVPGGSYVVLVTQR